MNPSAGQPHTKAEYKANSITLRGAVAMGTGVMVGAGIFALTGQIAELAGPWFPLSFIAGAIVTAFSAYTYIKMSNAYPSSGGIAMILQKAYGAGAIAAAAACTLARPDDGFLPLAFAADAARVLGASDGGCEGIATGHPSRTARRDEVKRIS